VGGAIANDVHGKNHHKAGTFGCHVLKFELLRSNGDRLICSHEENSELFKATIGGLGLTGLILWAEIRLKRIPSPFIRMESIKFENLDEFFEINQGSDQKFDYTVSWVDCLSKGASLGKGIFMRGNFADLGKVESPRIPSNKMIRVPLDMPGIALNSLTVKLFNAAYYGKQRKKQVSSLVHYNPFFYPLDAVAEWNRIYGKKGFLQYQCLVPYDDGDVIKSIFSKIAASGQASFLAVLKICSDIASPGILSFCRKGITLALDFPNRGKKTFDFLDELDEIVKEARGSINPSKDARMSPASFQVFFPRWKEFEQYIDPKFSSSFWRRVTNS